MASSMGQFSRQSEWRGKPQMATPVGLGSIRDAGARRGRKLRESGNLTRVIDGRLR